MKKLFTVLAVLLVATALFAGTTVKAGGTFSFANMKNATSDEGFFGDGMTMKAHGFGFDSGVQYDVADNLAVYGEFNMVFPADAEISSDDNPTASEKLSDIVKDQYPDGTTYKINFFSVSAGVAYKLDFNAVKLAVGGGITLNRSAAKINYENVGYKLDEKQSFTNIGLNALVDAKYMFTENIGAGVTLNPQLGLYNISKFTYSETIPGDDPFTHEEKANGFKVSFAMPIVVGVSYSF